MVGGGRVGWGGGGGPSSNKASSSRGWIIHCVGSHHAARPRTRRPEIEVAAGLPRTY